MVQISPEEYRVFIQGLTLRDVRLTRGSYHSERTEITPTKHTLRVDEEATFALLSGGFEVRHAYTLLLVNKGTEETCCGRIEAEFALRFDSETPLTAEIFEIFRQVNLGMNTWPYWREFVQAGAARMNWPAITLPLLKQRSGQAERSGTDGAAKSGQPKAKSRAKAGSASGKASAKAKKKPEPDG